MMTLIMLLSGIQIASAQDLSFGVKAGLNYNIVTAENVDATTGFGFHVGPTLDLGLSDMLNFRIELLGSQRTVTSKSEFEFFGIKTVSTSKLSPLYLTVPILYNFEVSDGLSLFAGPQLSFLMMNKVSSEVTVNGESAGKIEITGEDATTGMRGFELGLAIGAEYNLSDNLGLGLRYVRSLQSITDLDNATNFYNVIQLSALYQF